MPSNNVIPESNSVLTKKQTTEIIAPEYFESKCGNHFHGGQLNEIAKHYNIPLDQWLDLSTGINPNGYPATDIPASVWNRLPENNDELVTTAAQYYQCNRESLLPVSGSQQAIQLIPGLFSNNTVGIIEPSYYEHAKQWKKYNHSIIPFQHHAGTGNKSSENLINQINSKIHLLDTLVIINPNNPSGLCFSKQQLLHWHEILIKRNAYLIIDEAFMDSNNRNSLISTESLPNLIVLRSIGKFFGLAGIRLGFVFSNQSILNKISEQQGPWPISGPSRWLACQALADTNWQNKARELLQKNSLRLNSLLSAYNLPPCGATDLFQWVQIPNATKIYHHLNQRGILTRLFTEPNSLRFGLPKGESQWLKLEKALPF